MNKKCLICEKTKSIIEFHKKRSSKDGHNSRCKICAKETARDHYYKNTDKQKLAAKKRDAIYRTSIGIIKQKIGCCCCGFNKYPTSLDLHHVDKDTKEFEISALVKKSIKKLVNELCKCIVVCANCHRAIHYENLDISHLSPIVISEKMLVAEIDKQKQIYGMDKISRPR